MSGEGPLDVKIGESKQWIKKFVKLTDNAMEMYNQDKSGPATEYRLTKITNIEIEEDGKRFGFDCAGERVRMRVKLPGESKKWCDQLKAAMAELNGDEVDGEEGNEEGEEEEPELDDEVDPNENTEPNKPIAKKIHVTFDKDLKDKIRHKMKSACFLNGKINVAAFVKKVDKDGSGNLNANEFLDAFRKQFKIPLREVSDSDAQLLFEYLDEGGEGSLDMSELEEFIVSVKGRKQSIADNKPPKIVNSQEFDEETREVVKAKLHEAVLSFGGPQQFYHKLERNRNGVVGPDEMNKGVRNLMRIKPDQISDNQLKTLKYELDPNHTGAIPLPDFLDWMRKDGNDEAADKASVGTATSTAHITAKMEKVMARLRKQIKVVTQDGKQDLIDKFYKDADANSDGQIDYKEMQNVIRKLLSFSKADFPEKDIKELFAVLDEDDSGEIDLSEFTQFITNPAYFSSSSGGVPNRLQHLYDAHKTKQVRLQQMRKDQEADDERKLEKSKAEARSFGSKKQYVFTGTPRTLKNLYHDDVEERAENRRDRERKYDEEKQRQIESSRMQNLPTKRGSMSRSASVPSVLNASEAGDRLYKDHERRARDRQQKKDEHELAEYNQFNRTPRSLSRPMVHQKMYEEAAHRRQRMESRIAKDAVDEQKKRLDYSVHKRATEEGRKVDTAHLDALHNQHMERQRNLAVERVKKAEQGARDQEKITEQSKGSVVTPRRRPSACADIASPRFWQLPKAEQEAHQSKEERDKKKATDKASAANAKKTKPLTTQADSALAAITKAIQFRCGFAQDADSIWDQEHRMLAKSLEAVMKVYKDALKNCEASEGYSALKSRASQRLFQEHLMPEFEGWARCIEPDPIRQVEDRLQHLMISARKAQLALKEAIAGCYWPEPGVVTASLLIEQGGGSSFSSALQAAIAGESGSGVKLEQVEIGISSGADNVVSIAIKVDTKSGPSAHVVQNRISMGLTRSKPGGMSPIEQRVSDQLGREGRTREGLSECKLKMTTQPQVQGAVRAHPDGVPIALFAYDAGVKPEEKAEAKALVRYGASEGPKRYRHLCDLARLCLVFSSCDMLQAGLDQILRRFEVVDVRNHFSNPGRLGLRYVEVLVIMHIDVGGERIPHVCEIRLEELCFHQATSKAAEPMKQLYAGFKRFYTRSGYDQDCIFHLVNTMLMKPQMSQSLRVFRTHLGKRFGSTVCAWRRALGGSRVLGFQKFRDVCQQLCCGEHATEFWQGLDPTLGGCISLFDLDPEATALLIKLRNRMLALADVSADKEVDAESLFARLSFLVRPKKPGHLEPHEFRIVAKPLGLSPDEADRAFRYLDYQGGSHHAPPATITVQDIAWLNRLPLRIRDDDEVVGGLIDFHAVTMTTASARLKAMRPSGPLKSDETEPILPSDDTESLRQLTWAGVSSRNNRNNRRGEILRWSIFKDGDAEKGIPRGSSAGRSEDEPDGFDETFSSREASRDGRPFSVEASSKNTGRRNTEEEEYVMTPELPTKQSSVRGSASASSTPRRAPPPPPEQDDELMASVSAPVSARQSDRVPPPSRKKPPSPEPLSPQTDPDQGDDDDDDEDDYEDGEEELLEGEGDDEDGDGDEDGTF